MWFHEAHICINRIFLVQNPPICSSSCNTFNAQYQFICWSAWLSPIHSPKMRSGESILTYIKPDRRLSLLTGNLFNLTCFFWCDSKTSFELFLNWSTLGREGVRDSSLSPDAAQTCVVESNKRDTHSPFPRTLSKSLGKRSSTVAWHDSGRGSNSSTDWNFLFFVRPCTCFSNNIFDICWVDSFLSLEPSKHKGMMSQVGLHNH